MRVCDIHVTNVNILLLKLQTSEDIRKQSMKV